MTIKKELEIINQRGLHARAASKLVDVVKKYKSRVTVSKSGQKVTGNSILGLMMLAAGFGDKVIFEVTGEDEQESFEAIKILINNRFDEE
ncbi:MAG: phosphocarrier protein HPr [Rhodospirillaceae bacterium]|nr:phosphocarrier protein HPr [Rhodospirillaceae bacterium]OUT76095.1 MAG: phosphocarrier protein HPr [Rhodospirillaceae bacterium TMED23]|tara:strand:+ start:244 stop:513 length:270 start_codon:yes stop_codon:yes gene_type:complete